MRDRQVKPMAPAEGLDLAIHGPPATDGRLVYAVGDIHGRLDLLDQLMVNISRDAQRNRGAQRPVLIFLGDYIDRGIQSRGVIDRLVGLSNSAAFELRALKGNHEDALQRFLHDARFGPTWCDHGGAQTLASYGVTAPRIRSDIEGWTKAREEFQAALSMEHRRFFDSLELSASYGEYLFVHAGVRPGAPLSAQTPEDLLWIREAFLLAGHAFEKIIVHGHTPEPAGFIGEHRIGVDSGAYATGVLTAVRLENGLRRLIRSSRVEAHRASPQVAGAGFMAKSERFRRLWVAPAEA